MRQNLREEYLKARRSVTSESLTEDKSRILLEKSLQLKEKQLELDRRYSDKFTEVITSTQLLKLHKAEEDFRKMLIERIEHRKNKRNRVDSWRGP